MSRSLAALAAAALFAAGLLAGCGGGKKTDRPATTSPTTATGISIMTGVITLEP